MLDFALGELGLTPDYFWELTWPEYTRIVRGHRVREQRRWAHTREILAEIRNSTATKEIDLVTGPGLWPLPLIDPKPKPAAKPAPPKRWTAEELREIQRGHGMLLKE